MMLHDVYVRVSASGLRRFSLWCVRVCSGVSLLPVLVTWLLPVAGTTYKPAVIKVFDLLSLPAETHISRPANTVLLPPWSMTEGEARATNWQCRDWTRGWGDGEGGRQGGVERQKKLVKRKSEWDRGEVKADEISWWMHRPHVGLHIWKKHQDLIIVRCNLHVNRGFIFQKMFHTAPYTREQNPLLSELLSKTNQSSNQISWQTKSHFN